MQAFLEIGRRGRLLRSLSRVQARALTEELIGYDTSTEEGIKLCAGFVKGWLDARDIAAEQMGVRGLPVTVAEVGPADGKPVLASPRPPRRGSGPAGAVHSPHRGRPPLRPRGLRHEGCARLPASGPGRPALAGPGPRPPWDRPDEESEEETDRGGDRLVEAGFVGDFAITGEPTDLNVGVAAKGVLAMRLLVSGRAAHGATPWLGENAILRAYEVFREVESLPFARQSSELFDRPSINLGRILGGDALNKVPDSCVIDVDVRYLPEQDPGEILAQVRGLEGTPRDLDLLGRPPARSTRSCPTSSPCGMPPALRATGPRAASRPRRRLGRGLLPARRRPGRGVRADRRRPPRPRGVGLGALAGEVPPLDR